MMTNANEEAETEWHDRKSAITDKLLGKDDDMVMHVICSYASAGSLDLSDYPNKIPGTALVTKNSEFPGQGSSNDAFRSYELVRFTRRLLDLDNARVEMKKRRKRTGNIRAMLA